MLSSPGDVAFTLFGFPVYYYGIIMACAVFVGFLTANYIYRTSLRTNEVSVAIQKNNNWIASSHSLLAMTNKNLVLDISPWLIISGIIGARLYYCIVNYSYYIHKPLEIFFIRQGGLSVHGMIIAGALALLYFSKKYKIPFFRLTDVFLCGTILAQSIGRWGNFFNSEAFGYPCDLPWKLYIPISHRPIEYVNFEYFHPTFLYESILDFGIFIILIFTLTNKNVMLKLFQHLSTFKILPKSIGNKIPKQVRNDNINGIVTSLYLILYGIVRIFVEHFRIDSALNILGFPIAQIISLLMLIVGIVLMTNVLRK